MHWKKLIAPVIVAVIVIIILLIQFTGILYADISAAIKIPVSAGLIALIGVVVYVLTERIKEIRSGDEDDLSKY